MANPTKYVLGYDFSDFSAHNPRDQQSGDRLDVEFENIELSIGETVDALADIRRSDGALVNGIVTQDSLAPGLLSSLPTATQMLASLLTVDGVGSGLDADLLDGHSSGYFQVQSANLDAWSAVAPASYLTVAAAVAGYQPLDSDLSSIAGLATQSYGRSLLTLANATALAAEVDPFFLTPTEGNAAYQPIDADLTAIAALTTTAHGRALLTKTAAEDVRLAEVVPTYVSSAAALKALDTTKDLIAIFDNRTWKWTTGDFSSYAAVDANEAVYKKANAIANTAGMWVASTSDVLLTQWFDAGVSDTDTLQKAINLAAFLKKRLRVEPKVWTLTSSVSSSGYVDVDATNAEFAINHTGSGFDFSVSYAEVKALSANYTIGATTIAVSAMSQALAVGEPFKIFSNAVDGGDRDSGSGASQYRTGEWAVATDGTTTTSIAIEAPLRFVKGVDPTSTAGDEAEINSFTTTMNARVFRLESDRPFRWVGGKMYYHSSVTITGAGGATASVLTVAGRVRPTFKALSITRGGGQGIALQGNYLPVLEDCDIRNLTDDTANSHLGYGVADTSYGTRTVRLTGGNVRHLYTSAVPQTVADETTSAKVLGAGRCVGAKHVGGWAYGSGASNEALWDTHHASEDVTFEDCRAEGCGGPAFHFRGRNIAYIHPVVRDCARGIKGITEFDSGDTNDDLWLAKKDQQYFSSARIVDADIECETDPFEFTQATVHISGSTRIRSAGHRGLLCTGSEVHIYGHVDHIVNTILGSRSIQVQTAIGWMHCTDVTASANGAIPVSTVVFERGSSVDYDASLATDGSSDLRVFDFATNCVLECGGQMDLALSNAFKFAPATGTLKSQSLAGWITYSFAGAADNTITLNTSRTSLRVRALDGTMMWDGAQLVAGESEKLLYSKNNVAVTHTGTLTATDIYTPPQPQAAVIDEADHYQRVEVHLSKTGSAGTAIISFRSASSFNESITMAAGDAAADLIMEMFTRGNDSQRFQFSMRSYTSASAESVIVRSFKTRTFDIGGGANFCTLRAQLGNTGDSVTVETVRMYGDKGGFN